MLFYKSLYVANFGFNSISYKEIVLKRVQIVCRSPMEISRSKVTVVETAVVITIRNLNLFITLSSVIVTLALFISPLVTAVIVILIIFFVQRGHIGVTLIQLEFLSLFALYLVLVKFYAVSLKTVVLYLLFCVMASEAALGLSFLVVSRRQNGGELEKFSL